MEANALKEIINSELAVAVYFSAPNCSVCYALKPKVEALFLNEFPAVKFIHVEIDKSPGISGAFGVFSAPTLLVFFEGKEFLRKVRLMSIQELQQKIERPYKLLIG
ncbi:thioredoxin family protein [Aequorivita sp. F47161]|uniref:Thioredoxin family protein n=1 Tax=Aequorivita vitellina TaxID=2874475 RepID=A0A9X1U0R2_9FLAO|nr:thioredoxin family protein [Aequorivita vitellina]MCG2419224.1 thioredoxin family protein [Aequorivita vitellina]